MNANEFLRNCELHSPEELAPYAGQYVAWSQDGKQILASDYRLADLFAELKRRGITEYVIDRVEGNEARIV